MLNIQSTVVQILNIIGSIYAFLCIIYEKYPLLLTFLQMMMIFWDNILQKYFSVHFQINSSKVLYHRRADSMQ